ncbi:MAG: filamentous hemagglutinin N-terminal domain-containing protein [Methylococcales bacterium]|nr:filamentous hemagglutinin N-terminal domain-containing protein [Methylococcales bacterium]
MNNKTKWFVLFPLSFIPTIYAEVIVDGSLGGGSQALTGPVYNINEGLGARQGANLFHSFSQFNINSGETAQFTTNAPTQNILARVTGGQSSLINGNIISSSSANLWLMNPAGWVVGSNANFNVNGNFHLTSAHGIGFTNGDMFFADPVSESVLSVADPIDYQFKSGQQAEITFDHADLIMQDGKDIVVVGGDIKMNNSSVKAAGARVLLASNSGQGQWHLDDSGLTQISGSGGIIDISHDKQATPLTPSLTSSVPDRKLSGGAIQLSAKDINLKKASINSFAFNDKDAGLIKLKAETVQLNSTFIDNGVNGSKNAEGVRIIAGNLMMDNGSKISSDTNVKTTGKGGNIFVDLKGQLTMLDSKISSTSLSEKGIDGGGNIQLKAGSIQIHNGSALRVNTNINSGGNAGSLTVTTDQLSLNNGGVIDSSTEGAGNGGDLTIVSKQIFLNQEGHITSASHSGGNAGNITIETNDLTLVNDSRIDTLSNGIGIAGSIDLDIKGLMKLQQNSEINTSSVNTRGGNIIIKSQGLAVDQSQIVTSVENEIGKNGGDITINTDTLIMNGGFIQANTGSNNTNSRGGNIQGNAKTIVASQGEILIGGQTRLPYSPTTRLNVIQAAALKGPSGKVEVSPVELNIAGRFAKVDSSFVANKTIANDPCRVSRDEKMSSLIETGHGGLPVKASDSINLPLFRYKLNHKIQPQSTLHSDNQQLTLLLTDGLCKQGLN